MTRISKSPAFIRHAITGAVALGMLAGCAGTGQFAKAISYAGMAEARSGDKDTRALIKAEQVVLKSPQDAAARIALANIYLQSGRFDSAATSFNDAMALGDTSPRTALSLALAHIGGGRSGDAVAILDQWQDSIPAGDLGLALSLAGQTTRGVEILSDALRAGDNSPKLRQNLAYAYALDGRWNEARIMASQDVPANLLDARISNWAMLGKPEDYQRRVAGLLGVPAVTDPGQPAQLALAGTPSFGPASAEAAQVAAAPKSGELTALDGTPGYADASPQAADANGSFASQDNGATSDAGALAPQPAQFADAFAPAAAGFVSNPVVQSVPARGSASGSVQSLADRPVARAIARLSEASATSGIRQGKLAAADCTHLVQLGSFSSEANARRAWDILRQRHPELRSHELQITPALVNGAKFWRVAASGFDRRTAGNMCSSVKVRGGGCIAYSDARPLPGALPGARAGAPLRARR